MLLSSGNDIARSQLQSQLLYIDDYDTEDVDPASSSSGGLVQQYEYTRESRIFDFGNRSVKNRSENEHHPKWLRRIHIAEHIRVAG